MVKVEEYANAFLKYQTVSMYRTAWFHILKDRNLNIVTWKKEETPVAK
jgi:hypothetical protein